MNIIKEINYRIKANNLVKLNKPLELMTTEELSLECVNRLKESRKTNKIDDRTNQIIELILNRETREKSYREEIITNLFLLADSYELRQEILNKYAKYIDEDNMMDFFANLENVEDIEIQRDINVRINRRILDIKAKLNPNMNMWNEKTVYGEKREELIERQKVYKGIVYAENLEKIDLMSVLQNSNFETFEKIYLKLPEEQKYDVLMKLIFNDDFIAQDERFKKLINNIPDSVIKEQILSEEFGYSVLKETFTDRDIHITLDDVKEFYRKHGNIKFDYVKILEQDDKVYTENELLEELKYLKDDYSKKTFLMIYMKKMDIDKIDNLIFNQAIDSDLRLNIIDAYITRLSDEDKISIFSRLDDDVKNKAYKVFTKYSYRSDKKYVSEILSQINDEHIYIEYVINFFKTRDIDIELVFNALSENLQYLDELSIYDEKILKFSDKQIKELYEKASDKAKSELLDITRRKKYSTFSFSEEKLSEQEIEEYNKDKPEYILVNENNYFELLKNAEELTLKKLISFENYRNLLTKEQCIEVIDKLKYYSDSRLYLHKIMPNLYKNLSIEEIKDTLLKIDDKLAYEYVFGSHRRIPITEQELENELIKIGDIKDKSIQAKYVEFLINNYKENNVSNILEKLIKSEDTSIENKYLYLSNYFFYNQSFDENQKEKIKSKKFELYKYVNELAGKEKYNAFANDDKIFYRGELLPYFYDDKVYEILMSLYESNHEVISTISPALLNKSVLDKIDYELIEFYSRYYSDSSLKDVLEDEDKAITFINSYNRLNSLKAYPEEDLLAVIKAINRFSKGEITDIDKLISISQGLRYSEMKNFDTYEEQIKEKARNVINEPYSSRIQLLDAIGKRFFNLSYKEMKDMVIKYNKDSHLFINQYESKEQLTPEEQNELYALKTIRNLKEIISIKDKKAIIDTFNELDKDENFEHIDFTGKIVLDENVRRVFNKDYIKDLYSPKDSDKVIIDGIEVYNPKEFKMFVHVVGAYSDFNLVEKDNPEKSAVEAWNNNKNKQSHIMCTSYIRNSNLSYVKIDKPEEKEKLVDKIKQFFKTKDEEQEDKKDIILGFKDIGVNAIQMSDTADIAVKTNSIGNQNAYRYYTFRSADNLSNCTRIMYNEVDIERRLEENKINNIKPSYVVCFDEITEESKKVANDFGIPIVYLNNRDIAKNESEKLEKTFDLYKNTKDPKLLKDIIVQYINNTVSFSFKRKDLIDEYFNENEMTKRMNGIVEDLVKQHKLGNKEEAEEALVTLYEAFNDEVENYIRANVDPSLYNISDFDVRQFAFNLKNILKSMGVNKEDVKYRKENRNSGKFKSYQDDMFTTIKQVERNNDER